MSIVSEACEPYQVGFDHETPVTKGAIVDRLTVEELKRAARHLAYASPRLFETIVRDHGMTQQQLRDRFMAERAAAENSEGDTP